jgi:hypothetical protein
MIACRTCRLSEIVTLKMVLHIDKGTRLFDVTHDLNVGVHREQDSCAHSYQAKAEQERLHMRDT